jgi:hypothetical protein
MRSVLVICTFEIVLMLFHNHGFCQIDLSVVTVRAGAVRSESMSPHGWYLWSFYPEVGVGGGLFVQGLSWGVTWGYWTDGKVEAEYVPDFVQYSGHGHILSGRASVGIQSIATHFPIPFVVSAGLAYTFSELAYVGQGTPWHGPAKYSQQTTVGLLGLAVEVPVSSRMAASIQAVQFLPFGNKRIDYAQTNRRAFTLGLSMFL